MRNISGIEGSTHSTVNINYIDDNFRHFISLEVWRAVSGCSTAPRHARRGSEMSTLALLVSVAPVQCCGQHGSWHHRKIPTQLVDVYVHRRYIVRDRWFTCNVSMHGNQVPRGKHVWNNIALNWIELNRIELNRIDSTRIESNRIESNWIELNWIEFNSIQFNSIQSNRIQFNSVQFNSIQFNSIRFDSFNSFQFNSIQIQLMNSNLIDLNWTQWIDLNWVKLNRHCLTLSVTSQMMRFMESSHRHHNAVTKSLNFIYFDQWD